MQGEINWSEEPRSKLRGIFQGKIYGGFRPHSPLAIHPWTHLQGSLSFSHKTGTPALQLHADPGIPRRARRDSMTTNTCRPSPHATSLLYLKRRGARSKKESSTTGRRAWGIGRHTSMISSLKHLAASPIGASWESPQYSKTMMNP